MHEACCSYFAFALRERILKTLSRYFSGERTSAQFFRFLMTGVVNTLFGYVVFSFFIWIHTSVVAALILANIAGVVLNFQTIGRLVFRRAERHLLIRFIAVYVGIFFLNWLGLESLVHWGVGTIAAQGLLVPLLAVCSFLANKLLVFESYRTMREPTVAGAGHSKRS